MRWSLAASAASRSAARPESGVRMTVERCSLPRNQRLMAPSKTFSPEARRALRAARGFSQASGAMGSPSYSHVARLRIMAARPRGNRPELFSRRSNSTLFTAASTAAAGMPFSASSASVSMISISTSSAVPGVMERRPTEKNVWRRSVSRPPPVRSSPSPDSISA